MKRCLSAPCLVETDKEAKKVKPTGTQTEPNTREYLQLALAKVLELQQEIKDGVYDTHSANDRGEADNDEEILKEVLGKVFENLPGTKQSVGTLVNAVAREKQAEIEGIRGKKIQLLGYDTCRRTAIEFMKNTVRGTNSDLGRNVIDFNVGFQLATYSKNVGRIAHRRSGLLGNDGQRRCRHTSNEHEIRLRMLRSLDLHLATKQRDYTAKLMRY